MAIPSTWPCVVPASLAAAVSGRPVQSAIHDVRALCSKTLRNAEADAGSRAVTMLFFPSIALVSPQQSWKHR